MYQGDDPNETGVFEKGIIYTLTGNISVADPDAGDNDFFYFYSKEAGTATVYLNWLASGSDYDVVPYDLSTGSYINNDGATTAQPELTSFAVSPGVPYGIAILGYSGSPGPYVVTVELQ
jgi:hypothetical protein